MTTPPPVPAGAALARGYYDDDVAPGLDGAGVVHAATSWRGREAALARAALSGTTPGQA